MKKICLLFLLYCNINTFSKCCDYCCDGVKKKTEWEFFKEYNTQEERADAWKTVLSMRNLQDDAVVPVVFEQYDKKKGVWLHKEGGLLMFAISKNDKVKTMYDDIVQELKLKSFVLYFNGDPNLKYDGTQTTLGEKLISDEDFLFDKNSKEPLLQRAVFISYYAEKQNTKN